MGGLIMTHSDDEGLVLPPKLAPTQVVVVPIFNNEEQLNAILSKINPIVAELKKQGVRVKIDDRDTQRPGWKFAEYEFKGVPVRVAVGSKDLENNTLEIARRDEKTKLLVNMEEVLVYIQNLLIEIQSNLLQKAKNRLKENTHSVDSWEEFEKVINEKGGLVYAHWDGTTETEKLIKEKIGATIRCIPLGNPLEEGKCILTGKASAQRVLFAKAY
jgi:prolyl-tRNA synthetase